MTLLLQMPTSYISLMISARMGILGVSLHEYASRGVECLAFANALPTEIVDCSKTPPGASSWNPIQGGGGDAWLLRKCPDG
jgi:hypothetical protein